MSQGVEAPTSILVSNSPIPPEATEHPPVGRTGFFAGLTGTFRSALRLDEAEALQRSGSVKAVSECLREVDTPLGRQLLSETLAQKPFPHFEPSPDRANYWVRLDADGTRTVGKFVGRSFVTES